MTQSQIKEQLVILSYQFGVKPPRIEWNHNSSRALYTPKTQTITLGWKCHSGIIAGLLHEFAHHLNFSLWTGRQHDEKFKEHLIRVVNRYRANHPDFVYPWNVEYPEVRQYAASRGYHR